MSQGFLESADGRFSRLRREDLAIRTVAVSLRSALREIRSAAPPEARAARLAGLVSWGRDSIRLHERVVSRLKRAMREGRGDRLGARLDARLQDVRDALGAAERALHER